MSISFSRTALLKAAKEALSQDDKAQVGHKKDCEKYLVTHAADSTARTREHAKNLRDAINRELRKAGPIRVRALRDSLGKGMNRDLRDVFYSPADDYEVRRNVIRPAQLLTQAQRVETKALIQVLETAKGETVTANELRLLGLKALGHVFQAAAGEVASS